MKPKVKIAMIAAIFLALSSGSAGLWHYRDIIFGSEYLLTSSAAELKKTVVSAHLEQPIEPGRNVLWCATFQLAWNEACELIGEDIHLKNAPPMAAILNKKTATKDDIDEPSYVAAAGWMHDGILDIIRSELDRKFEGKASPRLLDLIPDSGIQRPQDIVTYAYLLKNLQFPVPFEAIEEPLHFKGAKVACFGVNELKLATPDVLDQVLILDYKHQYDFVIELKTKSSGDRLILAKIPPENTVEETISTVNTRIDQATPVCMQMYDVLKVPKVNFDIRRDYSELSGKQLITTNPNVAKDLIVLTAKQDIRFQMNEKGVELESEAVVGFGCGSGPESRHIMIFDKPFLIMLKRANRKIPYFALWIDNPELLVKSD